VDKSGFVSPVATDDTESQGSDDNSDADHHDSDNNSSRHKESDSDAQDPDNNNAQCSADMPAAEDPESERLLQEYRAIAGVDAPGPASELNPEKMEADDTQELQAMRQQKRRYPARAVQKIPRYKEASSSVNSKDVDNKGTLYRAVTSLSPMPFRATHVPSP
jgi:hypothetical protein